MKIGTVIYNWEIIDRLPQRGGMAEIYKIRHKVLDQIRILKVLPESRIGDDEYIKRFERGIEAIKKLQGHVNIEQLIDKFNHEGRPCLVTEYIEGKTLDEILQTKGRLAPQEATDIIAQVLSGLSFAHNRDVIHRDIKPENIMVTPTGIVKIIDFGIAKIVGVTDKITRKGTIIGTFPYVAPEQLAYKEYGEISFTTDIYAVGAVFFELVTGRPLFEARNIESMIEQILSEMPPHPHELNPEVPPALSDIIMKAIAKNPSERFQSCHEFYVRLKDIGLIKKEYNVEKPTFMPIRTSGVKGKPRSDTSPRQDEDHKGTFRKKKPHRVGLYIPLFILGGIASFFIFTRHLHMALLTGGIALIYISLYNMAVRKALKSDRWRIYLYQNGLLKQSVLLAPNAKYFVTVSRTYRTAKLTTYPIQNSVLRFDNMKGILYLQPLIKDSKLLITLNGKPINRIRRVRDNSHIQVGATTLIVKADVGR